MILLPLKKNNFNKVLYRGKLRLYNYGESELESTSESKVARKV